MSCTTQDLHDKIVAVAPIDGVSIGDFSDKSTWTIHYRDSATDAQKAAAQAVIDAAPSPLVLAHKSITTAVFFDRLADSELSALELSADATVIKWRKKLPYCSVIEIDTEESEAMQAHLVSIGLFTSERKAEIFK